MSEQPKKERENMKPLSIQLYSLREAAAKDFRSVVEWVAKVGYQGIEPAGFFGMPPADLKKLADDLGLKIYSSHSPWAKPDNLGECMTQAHDLGLDTVVCGYGPEDFKDLDAIKRTAETTRKMQRELAANGFTLFQHNHYWEFERLDGRIKYEIYRELCPSVKYEIDCFWSTNKGTEDPVAMLKKFAGDTILLHMKDGICRQNAANAGMKDGLLDMKIDLLPLGSGDLPIRDLVAAAPEQVKTIVVELDYCEMDMFKAIEQSYHFMIDNGLAAGNR